MDRVTREQAEELDRNDKFWFIPIRGNDFSFLRKNSILRDGSGSIKAYNDIMDWYKEFREEYGMAFVVIISGVILRELGFKECIYSDTPQNRFEKNTDDFLELRYYGEVSVTPDAYFILSPAISRQKRIKIRDEFGGYLND